MTSVAAVAIAAAAGTTAIVAAAVGVMHRPLHRVLWQLCVLEYRARFWERISYVAFGAGVAMGALMGVLAATTDPRAVGAVATVVRWELLGAVAGVAVIATVVRRESARFDREGAPTCAVVHAEATARDNSLVSRLSV